MTISVGDRLPEATLHQMGENNPEAVSLGGKLKGRKVVIFGLPGAFTSTCTLAHVPSFIRTRAKFDAKGVDEIICISANDAYVMQAWGESTGSTAAGITNLGDPTSTFIKAIGMNYSVPASGFNDRSRRYAMYVVDGVVKVLHSGDTPGTCDVSGGENMLAAI